jgi:hypothetical protein
MGYCAMVRENIRFRDRSFSIKIGVYCNQLDAHSRAPGGNVMMKLPLKVAQDEPWIILDADDETVCEIDSQVTLEDDNIIAAEIVSSVNQRAEMVALLRRASEAVEGNLTFFQFCEIGDDIQAFLAKEPT